ncbi:MAG: nuclear transport factor 2 family protein [Dyadobacter sp.]|uniref:nuclear transport factor 2 family protein n=1 Tax=Dyadobacter sp. TaxID=1914288 RepID=UPI001B269C30|nr:nuclear transport factor 2 family protein [Dyadobacter sp.]MBO9616461.1 nuclear transport factor 2 family protein [Dyadobacter sp.]
MKNQSKVNIQDQPSAFIAIHQLIQRYTDMINLREWDVLPEIFSENAIWKALPPVNMQLTGLSAICDGIPESVGRTAFLVQFTTGAIIEMHDDSRASVRSHLTEIGRFTDTEQDFRAVGIYRDIVICEDGIWKFYQRVFELRHQLDHKTPGLNPHLPNAGTDRACS